MLISMTDVKFPLSIFDFFAHFLQGFLLLIGLMVAFSVNLASVLTSESTLLVLLIVLISYILGHIIAELARLLYERGIIKKLFGYPSDFVFEESKREIPLLNFYLSPYPPEFISEFKEAFSKYFNGKFSKVSGYNSFLLCFHTVKEYCPNASSRLSIFISMYDFSRNLSFVFLVYAIALVVGGILEKEFFWVLGGIISLIISIIFLLRYLKFFRTYANEVYFSFFTYLNNKR